MSLSTVMPKNLLLKVNIFCFRDTTSDRYCEHLENLVSESLLVHLHSLDEAFNQIGFYLHPDDVPVINYEYVLKFSGEAMKCLSHFGVSRLVLTALSGPHGPSHERYSFPPSALILFSFPSFCCVRIFYGSAEFKVFWGGGLNVAFTQLACRDLLKKFLEPKQFPSHYGEDLSFTFTIMKELKISETQYSSVGWWDKSSLGYSSDDENELDAL